MKLPTMKHDLLAGGLVARHGEQAREFDLLVTSLCLTAARAVQRGTTRAELATFSIVASEGPQPPAATVALLRERLFFLYDEFAAGRMDQVDAAVRMYVRHLQTLGYEVDEGGPGRDS